GGWFVGGGGAGPAGGAEGGGGRCAAGAGRPAAAGGGRDAGAGAGEAGFPRPPRAGCRSPGATWRRPRRSWRRRRPAGWEFSRAKPAWSPDEGFHRVITGSPEGVMVTVIGDDRSARVHELRDVLARNSVPFGFHPGGSPRGRAALRRLGVSGPAGPVLSLA